MVRVHNIYIGRTKGPVQKHLIPKSAKLSS